MSKFEAVFQNLDLSGAVHLEPAIPQLEDPASRSDLLVAIPLAQEPHDPTLPIEAALGRRGSAELDEHKHPFMSFAIGDVYKALSKIYLRNYTSNPQVLLANIALQGTAPTTVTFHLPANATGRRNQAVKSVVVYDVKETKVGGRSDIVRRELNKETVAKTKIVENPFFVKGDPKPALFGDKGYINARIEGRLGSA